MTDMERLTQKLTNGVIKRTDIKGDSVMNRLSDYEDTGFAPDEIAALEDERDKYKAFSDMISKLNNCNNCSLKKICCVRPGLGECVRYNCAMWRGLEDKHDC